MFESSSRLFRIESGAFSETGLVEIIIPRNVEFLGEECFSLCRSLSSVKFESGSCLKRIESGVFSRTNVKEVTLPSGVDLGQEAFSEWTKVIRQGA
jgi:hypothetical protein